ncbi:MAG: hypothetical protein RTU30_02340 [Candidatus Thorarchaeota archaeon]
MSVVRPRVESAAEAKASIQSSIRKIRQSISELSEYFRLLFDLNIVKVEKELSKRLSAIRKHVSELTDYLDKDIIKGEEIYQNAQEILEIFGNLSANARFIETIIQTETIVVMINVEAREIITAEPKTERPDDFRPRFKDWTVDGMRAELAAEFQLRFPVFLGRRITISSAGKGFEIHIEHVSDSPIDIEIVLETLKEKTEHFLSKALLDGPLTFMYDVTVYYRGHDNPSLIDCTIASPRDSYFR